MTIKRRESSVATEGLTLAPKHGVQVWPERSSSLVTVKSRESFVATEGLSLARKGECKVGPKRGVQVW